ncbi:MAG: hypothetical protein Q7S06_01190 [Nanoarchaeota archaeon]|nr:hypothetical protein [Nanoarchaeota archaeon]
MKKSIAFILILFLIPFLSAVTFDMKENLMSGETPIIKVTGYFFEPILPENILLYREHTRIPMQFEVSKIGEDYYIYADFSKRMFGNYSILIQNTRHVSLTETTEEDFGQNFTITKDLASFVVNPGVIITSENFLVETKSLTDKDTEVGISINPAEEQESEKGFFASIFGGGEAKKENFTSFTLSPGQTEDIQFPLNLFKPGINFVGISSGNLSYRIPVSVFTPTETPEEKTEFRFEPSELNITLGTDAETSKMIYLYNSGKTNIENISISLSNSLQGLVTISKKYIDELKNGSSVQVEVYVLASKDKKIIDGHVKAKINTGTQQLAYSQIHLSIIPGYVVNKSTNTPTSLKTCSDISGKICQANLECSGEKIQSSDTSICCLGNCVTPVPKKNNTGKIIGIILFGVVVGFVVWFYLKKFKKKTKKEVNLLDIAKEGTEKK